MFDLLPYNFAKPLVSTEYIQLKKQALVLMRGWGKKTHVLLYVQDFGGIWLDGLCELNEVEFMFWIRMSDDGVEVKAHSHEEMRNLDTFYCLCTWIWCIRRDGWWGKMKHSCWLYNDECGSGSLEKPKNVIDPLQSRDVQVEEVLNGS